VVFDGCDLGRGDQTLDSIDLHIGLFVAFLTERAGEELGTTITRG
jgi:hypothetical protein